ncbi:DUF3558 domain-containing protein [Actinocrispum sp. NPDC049592]|uniref:DUF3558 domain-containing protein n=1 Tax=Actinocrispum sp. NPDC049592 TaxID=3154835 RepID=UPI003426D756
MTSRRHWTAGLLVGLTLVASGCTGSPTPGPTPSASPSPTRLGTSAPPVARLWDASAYRTKPCGLFTDDQARVLGYNKPGSASTDDPDVATCIRDTGTASGGFMVKYYFATDLLGKIYRREILFPGINSASPITVEGQPALKPTIPGAEFCTVAVGLTNTQGFEVRIDDKAVDPCDRAVTIAETIMRNLGA